MLENLSGELGQKVASCRVLVAKLNECQRLSEHAGLVNR